MLIVYRLAMDRDRYVFAAIDLYLPKEISNIYYNCGLVLFNIKVFRFNLTQQNYYTISN